MTMEFGFGFQIGVGNDNGVCLGLDSRLESGMTIMLWVGMTIVWGEMMIVWSRGW